MLITRTSLTSNITRTRDLPITQEQLNRYEKEKVTVQEAFPHLSAADREFIMTGITDEEWDNLFKNG